MRVPGIDTDPARGERIRGARVAAGLTQVELGNRLGVADRTISSWENGGVLHHAHLRAAADELGVGAAWLLSGDDSAPPLTLEDHDQRMNTYIAALVDQVGRFEAVLDERVSRIETDLAALVDAVNHLLLDEELPAPPPTLADERRREAPG